MPIERTDNTMYVLMGTGDVFLCPWIQEDGGSYLGMIQTVPGEIGDHPDREESENKEHTPGASGKPEVVLKFDRHQSVRAMIESLKSLEALMLKDGGAISANADPNKFDVAAGVAHTDLDVGDVALLDAMRPPGTAHGAGGDD